MDDLTLLVTMGVKENYLRFKPYIKEYAVSKDVWSIMECLGKYYDSYPSTPLVKWDDLMGFYFMVKGKTKADKALIIRTIISNVKDKEIELGADKHSADLQKDLIAHYIKQDYATKIVNKALEISTQSTEEGIEAVDDLVKGYQKEVSHAVVTRNDVFVSPSLGSIMASVGSPGYNWRLEEFNLSLGPVRAGDLVVVGARPERGKTTLLASESSYFATQLPDDSRPLIWINNEERDAKVMFRIMQSYFGVTKEEIEKDIKGYEERYTKEVGSKILLLSDDSGINSVKQLNSLFSEYNPSIIVFDQLDKVYGFGREEREDLRLGKLYQWAREKAREYGPVITASQVDGTGEGEQWITMAQLRGTKTDKQGEADAIVTIGSSNDPKLTNNRYVHIPKNKLHGGPKSKEEFRHGYFEIKIKPEIARYVSSIK